MSVTSGNSLTCTFACPLCPGCPLVSVVPGAAAGFLRDRGTSRQGVMSIYWPEIDTSC